MKDWKHVYLCLRCGQMIVKQIYMDPATVHCPMCRIGAVYWEKQLLGDLGAGWPSGKAAGQKRGQGLRYMNCDGPEPHPEIVSGSVLPVAVES